MSRSILPVGTADAAIARLFPTPDPYAHDPVLWINERLGEWAWSKQREIAESVRDNPYTAVKACHGPGKSFIAARIACWWNSVHDLGTSFVITTAPTWNQVEAILWREMRRAHNKASLAGRMTLDCQWHMGLNRSSEELIAIGRKPQDYNEQAFQGIHALYLLVILDEACGIPKPLWDAVLSLVTGKNGRVLAIGNPDDPSSEFAMKCRPGSGFNVITISAYDTPNFTGEEIPPQYEYIKEALTSPQWVADRERDWGRGTALWVSKVEGEFPDISDDFLVTPAMLDVAYKLDLGGYEIGRYGLDVARYGDDKSVLYRNRGGVIRHIDHWAKLDTMRTAGRAGAFLEKHLPVQVPMVIDVIGLGAGVFDRLRERGFEVSPFEGSARAYQFNKFLNRRSELYWTFRQGLENGLIDLDPDDTDLANELLNIKWWINSSGKIVIEGKEDMRDRGVKSPNHADAAVLSTASINMLSDSILNEGVAEVESPEQIIKGIMTKSL